jgi:hypothetical protein
MNAEYESTMEQFRAAIESRMGRRYYFDEAPDGAEYPYRVGSFTGSFDDENAEIYSFELDYWDKGKTTRRIRNMIAHDAGSGDRFNPTGLNGARIILPSGAVALYKDNETPIIDPDKNIRRIRVGYTARFYDAIRGNNSAEPDTEPD